MERTGRVNLSAAVFALICFFLPSVQLNGLFVPLLESADILGATGSRDFFRDTDLEVTAF
jgi:hypothetical protein